MEPPEIVALEEVAYRAWPAAEVSERDGWRLRFTEGVTRRGNSVWPGAHGEASAGLSARIEDAVGFYEERDCPARFQIAPTAQPAGLDHALEARGFALDAPVSIQIAEARAVVGGSTPNLVEARTTGTLDEAWLALAAGRSRFATVTPVYRGILGRLDRRAGFCLARLEGVPVGVGLGVRDGRWAGVFSMLTVPEARGRGVGLAVLQSLARWAAGHGAPCLYLQVERDNPTALALYRRAGFREAYGYHYRLLGS